MPVLKFDISIDQQISELKAELAIRGNVYPFWMRNGKMNRDTGERKFATLRAALHTLMELREKEKEQQVTGYPIDLSALARDREEEGLPES